VTTPQNFTSIFLRNLNFSLFLFFSRENTKAVKSHVYVSRIGTSRVACMQSCARGQEGPYDRAEFTKENQNTAGNPIDTELLLQRMPPQSLASAALPCAQYAAPFLPTNSISNLPI
jgi:hypothetical protein